MQQASPHRFLPVVGVGIEIISYRSDTSAREPSGLGYSNGGRHLGHYDAERKPSTSLVRILGNLKHRNLSMRSNG